jgi:GxxExxY protein
MVHRRDAEDTEVSRNRLTHEIIGAAIEVHRRLGPGLLESAYETCLCRELSLRRVRFQRQVDLPIQYRGLQLDCPYRLDIVVPRTLIVEVKAMKNVLPVHRAQVLTYLKLTGIRLGLLINFNVEMLVSGLHRIINSHSHLCFLCASVVKQNVLEAVTTYRCSATV